MFTRLLQLFISEPIAIVFFIFKITNDVHYEQIFIVNYQVVTINGATLLMNI